MNPRYGDWLEEYRGYDIYRVRGGFIAENENGDCVEDVCSVRLKQRIDLRRDRGV